jgi:hypothetical protein
LSCWGTGSSLVCGSIGRYDLPFQFRVPFPSLVPSVMESMTWPEWRTTM